MNNILAIDPSGASTTGFYNSLLNKGSSFYSRDWNDHSNKIISEIKSFTGIILVEHGIEFSIDENDIHNQSLRKCLELITNYLITNQREWYWSGNWKGIKLDTIQSFSNIHEREAFLGYQLFLKQPFLFKNIKPPIRMVAKSNLALLMETFNSKHWRKIYEEMFGTLGRIKELEIPLIRQRLLMWLIKKRIERI